MNIIKFILLYNALVIGLSITAKEHQDPLDNLPIDSLIRQKCQACKRYFSFYTKTEKECDYIRWRLRRCEKEKKHLEFPGFYYGEPITYAIRVILGNGDVKIGWDVPKDIIMQELTTLISLSIRLVKEKDGHIQNPKIHSEQTF